MTLSPAPSSKAEFKNTSVWSFISCTSGPLRGTTAFLSFLIKLEASFNSRQESFVHWTDVRYPINIDIQQKYTWTLFLFSNVALWLEQPPSQKSKIFLLLKLGSFPVDCPQRSSEWNEPFCMPEEEEKREPSLQPFYTRLDENSERYKPRKLF